LAWSCTINKEHKTPNNCAQKCSNVDLTDKGVNFDNTLSIGRRMPSPTYWSGHDLDLRPLTLKTFQEMPSHVTNICAKFHRNPSTKYRYVASRRICVNSRTDGDGQTDRRTDGRTDRRTTQTHNAVRLILLDYAS